MAATEPKSALGALLQAALALPILAVPARAGAVESGEIGVNLLYYKACIIKGRGEMPGQVARADKRNKRSKGHSC